MEESSTPGRKNQIRIATDQDGRTPNFVRGWFFALHRIKGITAVERSPDEWRAILIVFEIMISIIKRKLNAKVRLRKIE